MDEYKDKYFAEFSIDGVLEVDEDQKEAIVDKINKLVSKVLKNEKAIHLNVNIGLISEKNLMFSMAQSISLRDEN